jgi:cadmium resistance protein CadD (predicted permease)
MLHVVVVVSPLPIFFARRLPFLFLSFFLTWIFRPPLSTWPISLGELIDFIVSGVLSLVWLLSLSLIPQKSVPLSSRSFLHLFFLVVGIRMRCAKIDKKREKEKRLQLNGATLNSSVGPDRIGIRDDWRKCASLFFIWREGKKREFLLKGHRRP